MIAYIVRRLLIAIPAVWLVLSLVFVGFRLVPGHPVERLAHLARHALRDPLLQLRQHAENLGSHLRADGACRRFGWKPSAGRGGRRHRRRETTVR